MPVISSNALVSVLDSYSWVGMVSDSTLISMPWKGLAALMNHCSSFSCASFESVEGWNSESIHFLAAASSADAGANPHASSKAATDTLRYSVMIVSSTSARCCLRPAPAHDFEPDVVFRHGVTRITPWKKILIHLSRR